MRVYSNNGLSWRVSGNPADAGPDEYYFDHMPSGAELLAAFPAFNQLNTINQNQTELQQRLALGVTFTGALSATFATDQTTQKELVGIATVLALNGVFPDKGLGPFAYPDRDGNPVLFATIQDFKSFYLGYVSTLLAMGQAVFTGQWPSQTVAL